VTVGSCEGFDVGFELSLAGVAGVAAAVGLVIKALAGVEVENCGPGGVAVADGVTTASDCVTSECLFCSA